MKEKEKRLNFVKDAFNKLDSDSIRLLSEDNLKEEELIILIKNIIDNFNIIKEKGQDTFEYIQALTILDSISNKYYLFDSFKELLIKEDEDTKKRNSIRNNIINELEKYDLMQKKREISETEIKKYYVDLNNIKSNMQNNKYGFDNQEYNELLYELERRISSANEILKLKRIVNGEEYLV